MDYLGIGRRIILKTVVKLLDCDGVGSMYLL